MDFFTFMVHDEFTLSPDFTLWMVQMERQKLTELIHLTWTTEPLWYTVTKYVDNWNEVCEGSLRSYYPARPGLWRKVVALTAGLAHLSKYQVLNSCVPLDR